jgi:MraZ protein
MMYRGSYEAKITDGRLRLPTDFEKVAIASNVNQFFVTSADGKSAEIWPLPEWEKREAKLVEYSTLNKAIKKYLRITGALGLQVEMDKQARITLPKILRGKAGLEGEVVVIGNLSYMEVVSSEVYQETLSSAMSDDESDQVAGILGPSK